MKQPEREIIFGVCDKTGNCNSYFGFFKNEEDAKKEVKIQADRLKEDLGLMDIIVKEDRAVMFLNKFAKLMRMILNNSEKSHITLNEELDAMLDDDNEGVEDSHTKLFNQSETVAEVNKITETATRNSN